VERSELGPALLGSPCGDRGHPPPAVLQDTPPAGVPPQQPIELWREMLDGPEGSCGLVNDKIRYLPEPGGMDEPTQDVHHEGEAEGLLRNTRRWMTYGVTSAYIWWNPSYGETEDPEVLTIINISRKPPGVEYTVPFTLWEESTLATGERREGLPNCGAACAPESGTHSPLSMDIPIPTAEPEDAELELAA
jgi:hypothetical protein